MSRQPEEHSTPSNGPWNQAAVTHSAAVFGRWPVGFAEAGAYLVGVRRCPHAADAPPDDVSTGNHSVDAHLNAQPVSGLLCGGGLRALLVARVQLKIGASIRETAAGSGDRWCALRTKVDAGPTDIEASLLDATGKPLVQRFLHFRP